ncbi:MAG: DUF4842 domain-containing protein [archaeon]|nr:MAG: DUF4842 domain-containing protein [archaeon]
MKVKILLTITAIVLMIAPSAVLAHTEDEPYVTDLIAGQHTDVGDVLVWNDADNLYVKYLIEEEGWCLTETHLHVADSWEEIPQTEAKGKGKGNSGGNPIPGQFEFSGEHDCIAEHTYTVPLGDWDCETDLAIAAHAVVVQKGEGCMNVVSDSEVDWSADGSTWNDAVACWDHPNWNDVDGATWIWRTYYTDVVWEYDNVPADGWYFMKTFDVPGEPVSGQININADNAYKLYLNGDFVGEEGAMDRDGPDYYEWGTEDSFALTNLDSGTNEIEVRAMNYFRTGSSTSNPAGLAFNAEICYEEILAEETAWGDGEDFPGNNWGMYFTYQVQCEEEVRYPETGNVYIGYEDWPNGDFDYNDFGMRFSAEEIYVNDELTEVTMTFEAIIYDSGMDHLIHINRPFNGDYTYTVSSVDDYTDETPAGTYYGTGDLDVVLFNTAKYTHPEKQIGEIVTVYVVLDDPSLNPKETLTAPRWDLDPFMANYDPWEIGTLYGSLYHIDDIQDTSKFGGTIDVPYILVVPETDWIPPKESTIITNPYGYFDDFYSSDGAEHTNWYSEITNSGGLSW